mmetsp:Transcript_32782/g.57042  ORF Transcript_32782/g.57042 Transcript_32782/m.57042 type:complete len:164 (+) Transcript_32782:4646-5137(+)
MLFKEKVSEIMKSRKTSQTEISMSGKKITDVERLVSLRKPRRFKRELGRRNTHLNSCATSKEVASPSSLEASKTLTGSQIFSFADFVMSSESRTQLFEPKKVREIINLPKLPFGRHKDLTSPRFKREFIRETESTSWVNVNNSKRKSPRARAKPADSLNWSCY